MRALVLRTLAKETSRFLFILCDPDIRAGHLDGPRGIHPTVIGELYGEGTRVQTQGARVAERASSREVLTLAVPRVLGGPGPAPPRIRPEIDDQGEGGPRFSPSPETTTGRLRRVVVETD